MLNFHELDFENELNTISSVQGRFQPHGLNLGEELNTMNLGT
jgi:hypothetical protein